MNKDKILAELIYQVLYKHVASYWDENGRLKVIYAGERLPQVSDNPNQLDQLLAISDEIAEQILTEQEGNTCKRWLMKKYPFFKVWLDKEDE